MTIPLLPAFYNMTYTDKDGRLTSDSYLYNDQTFQVVNDVVNVVNSITTTQITTTATTGSNAGTVSVLCIVPPSYTNTQVTTAGFADSFPVGGMWYNSTLTKMQFKSAAGPTVISTITSAP